MIDLVKICINILKIEWVRLIITFIIGSIVGFIVVKILVKPSNGEQVPPVSPVENMLTDIFGKPMFAAIFTLAEARDWIKARQEKLKSGNKAVVLKINANSLEMFWQELRKINININSKDEQFLVVTIINTNSNDDIIDSLLVKYKKLDEKLESLLSRSNGKFIVEA